MLCQVYGASLAESHHVELRLLLETMRTGLGLASPNLTDPELEVAQEDGLRHLQMGLLRSEKRPKESRCGL